MLNVELSYAYPCTSKLRRIYTDLIMRYKIVFGIVKLEIGNFFPLTLPFLAYASLIGSSLESLRARPTQSSRIQSATWTCTKLPRATCPRRRCVWSSSTPLRRHESHPGAASHVHHRRQSSLPGRCPTNLEFSTRRRYLR